MRCRGARPGARPSTGAAGGRAAVAGDGTVVDARVAAASAFIPPGREPHGDVARCTLSPRRPARRRLLGGVDDLELTPPSRPEDPQAVGQARLARGAVEVDVRPSGTDGKRAAVPQRQGRRRLSATAGSGADRATGFAAGAAAGRRRPCRDWGAASSRRALAATGRERGRERGGARPRRPGRRTGPSFTTGRRRFGVGSPQGRLPRRWALARGRGLLRVVVSTSSDGRPPAAAWPPRVTGRPRQSVLRDDAAGAPAAPRPPRFRRPAAAPGPPCFASARSAPFHDEHAREAA
jgi:hypothetical protein